ncbi:hypothetical protein OCL06_01235 [Alteromonas sp. ASW11-19]|uniref:ATPase BadF/BadG/BcrA/BcrD type domain-containing protein n=1 Tax=Alteromonas salexigens TaxID=2982530 RepID=A0ABT2VJ35_9ALTE|nr:BadF/BadG/BcrA/BcrD ATPase family protein [Alteromonas salexigens]MCU7553216.1 hypothetical protein [Alteromonas salexigens]
MEKLIVGVDGGGTSCKAQVFTADGKLVAAAHAGPANAAQNFALACQSLVDAVSAALRQAGYPSASALSHATVCAGLAGANVPSVLQRLVGWKHPFADFHCISDLQAAVTGAHQGSNGATLVVGTGSCAASLHNGQFSQFGGHGLLLGDKGSGAWIGQQAVAYTLRALDGLEEKSDVERIVCTHYECSSAVELVDKLHVSTPGRLAELAPAIIKAATAQDPAAVSIVKDGTAYLSALARQATYNELPRTLMGGVASALLPWLDKDIQQGVVEAAQSAQWGACYHFGQIHKHAPSDNPL